MTVVKPEYYDRFSCLAGSCPDSCCQQWEVDIDEASAQSYLALPGDLGDRLRQVILVEDGAYRMRIENDRCPMWRQDGLCRIQAELGHDALCATCREFPRLRHDYGDFVELGLELSCPEAARLILAGSGTMLHREIPGGEAPEYDNAAMAVLLRSRTEFLTFLHQSSLSFPQLLTVFLLYAHSVQAELDGGTVAALCPDIHLEGISPCADFAPLLTFFSGLEILTPQWRLRLQSPTCRPQWTLRHKALLRYFVQRYWLQAVSDYDLIGRAKFTVAACLLIGCLGGDLTETAQLFSKEIENDPDNMDTILDGAYTSPALTDRYLLELLTETSL